MSYNDIIALAHRSIAVGGNFNTCAIASETGVSPSTVRKVLRRADRDGGLARTCTTTLGNGKRCGAPLPVEAWGRLATTCCALHTKLDAVTSAPAPVAATIAEAGTGKVLATVPKATASVEIEGPIYPFAPPVASAPVKTYPLSVLADLDAPIPYRPAPPAMPEPVIPEQVATPLDALKAELVEGEMRVSAVDIAAVLGFERPRNIIKLVKSNQAELAFYGEIRMRSETQRMFIGNGATREQEVSTPWLNREQALALAAMSKAPNAARVRGVLIKAFVQEQDRAIAEANGGSVRRVGFVEFPPPGSAPAPALDSGLAPIVAELVRGQQQTAQALAGLTAALASLASQAASAPHSPAPRGPAPPPVNQLLLSPAFDVAASAAAKGDWLSVSDLASRVGLPMDDRRESSKRLVTTWLQETRLWRLPSVSRNIRMGVVAGGHASERDHWVYDPEVLAFWEAGVLRDAVASVLRSGDVSTRRAYETARAIIRVGLGRKAS